MRAAFDPRLRRRLLRVTVQGDRPQAPEDATGDGGPLP